MNSGKTTAAADLRKLSTDQEARREAARLLGMARTPKKAAANRAKGFKPGNAYGGRAPSPLFAIACSCPGGESLEGHHWSCPRGQAIKRRKQQGRDLMTGQPLEVPA